MKTMTTAGTKMNTFTDWMGEKTSVGDFIYFLGEPHKISLI